MIRVAEWSDVDALVALGEALHRESPVFRGRNFCGQKVRKVLVEMIAGSGVVFISEQEGRVNGAMLGFVQADWFGHDLTACELCLFVLPGSRGAGIAHALVCAFEQWAELMGACLVSVGVSTGINTEVAAGVYESMGYVGGSMLLNKEIAHVRT